VCSLNAKWNAEENVWTEDEVLGVWRIMHNEELRNIQSSANVLRLIKSRMRYLRNEALM
jgi:hypothetical protein